MENNRVTVRYARALIELAIERNVLNEVDRDVRVLYQAIGQYKGFSDYILNPGISSMEKFEKIKSIFAKQFHDLSMKFLELVFSNKREEYLKDLCRNCIDMARQSNHIVTANLKSAVLLAPEVINRIKDKFEHKLEVSLEMATEADSNIIGGFIFTIDGQQYDASVASRIKTIKQQLHLK